jgi:hypothetical protein
MKRSRNGDFSQPSAGTDSFASGADICTNFSTHTGGPSGSSVVSGLTTPSSRWRARLGANWSVTTRLTPNTATKMMAK